MLAVICDAWFRPQYVGDLFLRTRCGGLVDLELWCGRLIRAGNVIVRGMIELECHGESSVGNRYGVCGFTPGVALTIPFIRP